MTYWDIFGIQVQQTGYQGTVLPIIFVAFILANIEKFLHKVLKGIIDFRFTPTLTLLITGFLTFMLVGPPLFKLGTLLGESINWLYTTAGPVGGFLFGLVYSPIVITGLHQSFPPIEIQLIAAGGSFIFATASMSNVAQGGAALGVYLTTKDKKMKALAGATAPSAFLGITEPAIFGVKLRRLFYIAMGSSAVASTLNALFGVKAKALGTAGFLGSPSINNDLGMGWTGFFIAIIVSAVLSTVASFLYGKKAFAGQVAEEDVLAIHGSSAVPAAAGAATATAATAAVATEGYELAAHLNGTALNIAEVSDQTFASGALGPGAAIEPTEGKLYAPADGTITVAFSTGHAIGMRTEKGVEEVLMHIGFDTVELDGKFFTPRLPRATPSSVATYWLNSIWMVSRVQATP